ncbi:hypothetical protein U1Q18_025688 [Sarracenia purpurea var. burkii]
MSNNLRNGNNTNQFGVLAELDSDCEEKHQPQSWITTKTEGTKLKVVTSLEESLPEGAEKVPSVVINTVIEEDETGERRSPPFSPDTPSKGRTSEEDPKHPRPDRDVIEEALCIHDNLEVLL